MITRVLTVTALVLGSLVAGPAAAADTSGRRTHEGEIDGARFKVEMPDRWNGTLVLYGHPYYAPEWGAQMPIGHATRLETEGWLLDHGYALAASNFKGIVGFQAKQAVLDQIALLDWFEEHVGHPRRTVATGNSMGGAVALLLAEQHPDRVDGVLAMCAPIDLYGQWNMSLDVNFAVKTLLELPGQDIRLVGDPQPRRSVAELQRAVRIGLETGPGRARIALAGAFGNVDGWNSAHDPRPATVAEQIRHLAVIEESVIIDAFGPSGLAELAERAGGNPLWNVGVDYRRQFERSSQRDFVLAAYREAGLGMRELRRDLDRLAAAPRITPDPGAVRWMYRHAVPRGTTPSPVITLHNTVDAAVADHQRWYAGQVRRHGRPDRLRQVFAGRATHCAFSAAEEIVTLQALFRRIASGRWPSTAPARLNTSAGAFPEAYHNVFNYPHGDAVRAPAFTSFGPAKPLRPSR